jgi:peptide/nickel transport system ATP-binding protein
MSTAVTSADPGPVRILSDAVLAVKDGMVLEQASAAQILAALRQEYTRRLLAAVPRGYRAAG